MVERPGSGDGADRRHLGILPPAAAPAPPATPHLGLASVAALLVLAALLMLRGLEIEPLTRLRLVVFDLMQGMVPRAPATEASQVVIVAIDDASLAELGQWPWPRDLLASVVDVLDSHQVRLIALDILFPEPDRSRPSTAIDTDAALVDSIARSTARVVLGSALQRVTGVGTSERPLLPPTLELDGPSPLAWVPGAEAVMGNIPSLEAVADGRGFLTVFTDGDGVMRRLPLLAHVGANLQPGIVLELARLAAGADVATVRTHPLFGVTTVVVGDRAIPTDQTGALWIGDGLRGPRVPMIAVADLLAGRFEPDLLAGRIVLIGATAEGLGDRTTMAPGTVRSGVEVIAAGLESVLSAEPLARPGAMRWLEMLAALMIGLVLIYRMSLYTAVRTAIWAGIVVTVIAGIAVVLLAFAHLLVDPSFPILTTLIIATFVGYRRSREAERGRAQARRSLAEAAAFIHRLVDATFDSVIAVDRDGRLLFANRAARALPIFPAQPAVGSSVLALLRRADRPHSALAVAELAAVAGSVDLIAGPRGSAEPILLEATATALKDEPSGAVVLVMRDVTARRAAQRRIEDQARALEEMAGELKREAAAAVAARIAADNANAAKGEFLMMMSHELRTPLNAVIGFAELMAAEPFGSVGDKRYLGYIADIRASGAQLLAMIDSILEVIRLDRHDTVTGDGTFPLMPAIEECCAAMQPEAGMRSVELMSSGDAGLIFRGDVALIRHVLVSLLSNAIKFTEPGGRVSVDVGCLADGGVAIAVTDTGIGMSTEELDRAVLMLEHSGSSLTRSHGGAGVGLTLAKLATEKQGGEIRLSSIVGQGTTVEVRFPAARVLRPGAKADPDGAPMLRQATRPGH